MEHLKEYLNEEEGKNHIGGILHEMVKISNNSRMTSEMANVLTNELTPEAFKMLQRWLLHAGQQQQIKISAAMKSGQRRGGF